MKTVIAFMALGVSIVAGFGQKAASVTSPPVAQAVENLRVSIAAAHRASASLRGKATDAELRSLENFCAAAAKLKRDVDKVVASGSSEPAKAQVLATLLANTHLPIVGGAASESTQGVLAAVARLRDQLPQ